ncbi:GDCCVxC domain-containing (seleno)protein [Methylobacterium oryzae CBMB20]
MPTDACQFFYECTGCGTLLRPNAGDCCVFCSFGDVPCPPIKKLARAASLQPAVREHSDPPSRT